MIIIPLPANPLALGKFLCSGPSCPGSSRMRSLRSAGTQAPVASLLTDLPTKRLRQGQAGTAPDLCGSEPRVLCHTAPGEHRHKDSLTCVSMHGSHNSMCRSVCMHLAQNDPRSSILRKRFSTDYLPPCTSPVPQAKRVPSCIQPAEKVLARGDGNASLRLSSLILITEHRFNLDPS